MNDLNNEILELIKMKYEGEYWDFKQEWHSQNSDLLHDIICMANSPANRDCYIIIGVEDFTGKVLGVSSKNRKNQQNLIEMIGQKPNWAGGYQPKVLVRSLEADGKEIDIIIIKQSDNTPFYLLDDYTNKGDPVRKGSIYTRKGDTNTPRNKTADVSASELLWKRRFGLLYKPSQRAKFYLKDIKNWKIIEGENDKSGRKSGFYFYQFDPDYTVHFENFIEFSKESILDEINDINDKRLGVSFFYLYSFFNVSYHNDFSNKEKVIFYYKDIPLFSSPLETVDEGRTMIVPPEFITCPYYIKDSLRYLMFEFIFALRCGNYSFEAKSMLQRVIPLFSSELEQETFEKYIKEKGFTRNKRLFGSMGGEALTRFEKTRIENIDTEKIHSLDREMFANIIKNNPNCVCNFASKDNENINEITYKLQVGKMLVDWLAEWRQK